MYDFFWFNSVLTNFGQKWSYILVVTVRKLKQIFFFKILCSVILMYINDIFKISVTKDTYFIEFLPFLLNIQRKKRQQRYILK